MSNNKLLIRFKNNVVVVETINNGDKKEYRSIHKHYTINTKYIIGEILLINPYNVRVTGVLAKPIKWTKILVLII